MHRHRDYKVLALGVPIVGTLMFLCGLLIIWFYKGNLDGVNITLSYSTRQIQMEQIQMDSETFLIFMLAEEIHPGEEEALLRAQAIVARSKLWYEMKQQVARKAEEGLDVTLDANYVWQVKDMDISWCNILDMQKQWGDNFGIYYQRLMDAVQNTACEILTYNDAIMEGRWHSVSAGNTRPYTCNGMWLSGVEGKDSLEAGAISICYWSREPAITYLKNLYPELSTKDNESLAQQIEITKRDDSDYVVEVTAGEHVYTGEEVADLLKLPSSCFYIYDWQEGVRIVVKGQGNGYGISLKGAARMAENGADEKEILKYYYPDATVRQGIF